MAKFRLATLKKIRERDRDLAAKAVQEAYTAIEMLDQKKQEIEATNRTMDEARKNASNGVMDLHQILDAQRYQMILAAQSSQIAEHLAKLRQELERRQLILLQCQKAVKSLEKLKEYSEHEAQTEALRKQQDRLDEWASIRTAMQKEDQG